MTKLSLSNLPEEKQLIIAKPRFKNYCPIGHPWYLWGLVPQHPCASSKPFVGISLFKTADVQVPSIKVQLAGCTCSFHIHRCTGPVVSMVKNSERKAGRVLG